MTFRNVRFPTGISYGAVAGPEFATRIAMARSGKTQRNSDWAYPLRRFNVERALKTDTLRDELLAFFLNMSGAADTFRIKDPTDYTVTVSQGVFTALGSGTYQMWKRYTYSGLTKDVPVFLPVSGTISINAGALVQGTHYTIDYTTPSGVVTLIGSPTPTAPSTWAGQYDVHARFESDALPISIEDSEFYIAKALRLVEERNLT